MAVLRPGIYLEDNPPARSQYRVGRRDQPKPVIVLHTAESGVDLAGGDSKAENVANFIRNRSSAGSYHMLVDRDSIIKLVDFGNEAYGDGTGSNRWAVHISFAGNAAMWDQIPASNREQYLRAGAEAAALAAAWLESKTGSKPEPKLLTKFESDQSSANGFISHGRRDPGRRSDPGSGFPYPQFFGYYKEALNTPETETHRLQRVLGVAADGDFGPKTAKACNQNWVLWPQRFDAFIGNRATSNRGLIKWVQTRLNTIYKAGLVVDGFVGRNTDNALRKYLGKGAIVTSESFKRLTQNKPLQAVAVAFAEPDPENTSLLTEAEQVLLHVQPYSFVEAVYRKERKTEPTHQEVVDLLNSASGEWDSEVMLQIYETIKPK